MAKDFLDSFVRWVLRQYRRYLEKQIELRNWDPALSAKLDAVLILLDQ
jgi:hypothetical protein